jgi:hypothetical protein
MVRRHISVCHTDSREWVLSAYDRDMTSFMFERILDVLNLTSFDRQLNRWKHCLGNCGYNAAAVGHVCFDEDSS